MLYNVVRTFESVDETCGIVQYGVKPLWECFSLVVFPLKLYTKQNMEILPNFDFSYKWEYKGNILIPRCNYGE